MTAAAAGSRSPLPSTLRERSGVSKLNCWEYRRCGREPGGHRVDQLGVCPTAVDHSADMINGGRNGGRVCWTISGHFAADGEVRCATARELATCMACEFFTAVLKEEGIDHIVFVQPPSPRPASLDDDGLAAPGVA